MSTNSKAAGLAQSVIRRGRMRADNFTQVSNDLARDRRMSRRARGLFVEFASHQEGWMTSIAALVEMGPEGVHAIRAAIAELEKYGYLVRLQRRDARGRIEGTEYWITDCPEDYEEEEPSPEPSSGNRTTDDGGDSPSSEPSSGFPTTDEPHADEPRAEDRTHKKTNHKKTNEKKQEMPPSSASPAATGQESLLGDDTPTAASSAKKPRTRKTKQRTPEEQLRFDQASEVATWWWAQCDNAGVPKIGKSASNGFPGLVKLIESALADNYTQQEIAYALRRNPARRFPTIHMLETALMAVRGNALAAQSGPGQQRVATSDLRVSQVGSLMADYRQAAADGRLSEWMSTPENSSTPEESVAGSALPGGSW